MPEGAALVACTKGGILAWRVCLQMDNQIWQNSSCLHAFEQPESGRKRGSKQLFVLKIQFGEQEPTCTLQLLHAGSTQALELGCRSWSWQVAM